jgi:hypothetical protein
VPETDGVVTTNEFLTRTRAVVKALPAYPAEALEQGAGSIESIRIGVTKEGEVFKVKVPPTMNPLFKESVVAAVRQWNSGSQNGNPSLKEYPHAKSLDQPGRRPCRSNNPDTYSSCY